MTTISQYFETDHQRLDLLLEQFHQHLSIDITKSRYFFNAFASGLEQHIAWEEDVLFPFFETKTHMTCGPTHVMRQEHIDILACVNNIKKQLEQPSDTLENAYLQLIHLLSIHNQKEENVLYPMLDQHSNETDKCLMFSLMQTGQVA